MASSFWFASDSSSSDGGENSGRRRGVGQAPVDGGGGVGGDSSSSGGADGADGPPNDGRTPASPRDVAAAPSSSSPAAAGAPTSDREVRLSTGLDVPRAPQRDAGVAGSDAAHDPGSQTLGTRAHRDRRDDGTATPDAELVRAVLAGDVEAFGPLVERYQHDYVRFARRMLGSHDDADEALQAAFLRAYRALAQCRDPQRFGAWLYHIVANECRTRATRGGRRERRFLRDEATLERASVDHPADDGALRDEIQHALDQLPEDQREAFVLKHVEELSYDEMAEITGAGVSALKMRVKRACERLRDLLGERVYA